MVVLRVRRGFNAEALASADLGGQPHFLGTFLDGVEWRNLFF